MKKLLAVLLAVMAVGAVGLLGYLVLDLLDEDPLGTALPVSGSQPPSSGSMDLNFTKTPETEADTLDAIQLAMEQNPDTVGWLTVPGTLINGSVLQSYDNAYYLRRNEKGEADVYGCYFADCTADLGGRDILSPNTVIYGHSDLTDQGSGPRFSQLFRFADEGFATNHPTVSFSTSEEIMTWQIFAVFYTDTQFEYNRTDLTAEEFKQVVETARSLSLYDYGVEVSGEDKILTLSTCSLRYGEQRRDQRFVLMAKLLAADAPAPVTVSLTSNSSPAGASGSSGVSSAP